MTLPEIEKALKRLRLSGIRSTLETRILEAQAANLSFLEAFSAISRVPRGQAPLRSRLFAALVFCRPDS